MAKRWTLVPALFIIGLLGLAERGNFGWLVKGAEPQLLRGAYLQSATPRSIVIRWRTNAAERGVVRFGTTKDSLDQTVSSEKITMDHAVLLEGLQPATKYYYSIGGLTHTLPVTNNHYFKTLPEPGSQGKFRIAAFGDCGNNSKNQRQVRDQVLSYLDGHYLDSWILLGDNAYESGTDAEYQKNFFDVFEKEYLPRFPLFPAPGNHDYRDIAKYRKTSQLGQNIAYYQNFSLPVKGESGGVPSHNPAYYSFDIGNVHFLSLDSYGKEDSLYRMFDTLGAQVKWIKKDLAANQREWVVAYWHHPPFTMGSHNSDRETELVKIRENFIRILERYGVDLVLCGHSHSYERTRLLNGHYGPEASFDTRQFDLSSSSGLYNGKENSCPYMKTTGQPGGTVYVVSGSAGQLDTNTQKTFPHNAMYYSNATNGGAVMLEVEKNRLDVKWICADGVIRDQFTMMKEVQKQTELILRKGDSVTLKPSFVGDYTWEGKRIPPKNLTITPPVGTHWYTVRDKHQCIRQTFKVTVKK